VHIGHVVWLVTAPALLLSLPLAGQTLPARPVPFEDPVRGGSWKDGELVLGKTTLAGARRMLANAVSADNPRLMPEPVGTGAEGAALEALCRRSCAIGQHWLADSDGVLIDIHE